MARGRAPVHAERDALNARLPRNRPIPGPGAIAGAVAGALAAAASAGLLALLVVVASAAAPDRALAEEPGATAAPTSRPPTCAERFPDEGPAGVDLRLGCIVSEVLGWYRGAGAGERPPALSTYVLGALGLALAGGLVALLLARAVRRRAGQRLAPAAPASWWACGSCHSLNPAGTIRCYACGAPVPAADVLTVETAAEPQTPQGFGARRKSG